MASIDVGLGGTGSITNSGTDTVSLSLASTLNITGTAANPITVILAQVAGLGALDVINITNANVTLSGTAGVSALVQYNIGSGGTLTIASTLGVSAGTSFNFTGTNSKLVLANGIDLSLLGAVSGFAPGSAIDITGVAASASYVDGLGTGTGGTLNLLNSSGVIISSLHLTTGEYVTGDFRLRPDGNSGTLIDFGVSVTNVAFSPATADLGVGSIVAITVTTSAPVTVTGGPPTLTLNDGATAIFNAAASSGSNLVFSYTVAAGQNTGDLAVTAIALNGATATSANAIPVDLSGAAVNPAGILQIDTTAPTITSVAANPATGPLTVGGIVLFTLTTSEPVTVIGGSPMLTLSDGGTAAFVTGLSGGTTLVFRYTVLAGQNSTDLTVTGVTLNGALVVDGAGNPANFGGAVANPAGVLVIDTTAPTITGVSTTPGSGTLGSGQTVRINVAVSEPVTVIGAPTLVLSDGGVAIFNALASTNLNLVFTYSVLPGQNSPDLSVTSVSLNGGTITDAAGNAADLTGAAVNPGGVLIVDTTAPTVTGVTTNPATGTLGVGQVITFNVATSEAVTVTGGVPTLFLSDGGTATYDPNGSTSTNLVFRSTVQSGQNSPDLAVVGISTNGATVADAAGNGANLTGAAVNPGGVLIVDTTAPTVTGVTTNPATGTLGVGQVITFNVATSEAVTVTGGVPTLFLSDGGTATYDPNGSTSTNLVFRSTVQSGQNSPDLAVVGISTNGATVADAAGNGANLLGAITNPPGVLSVNTVAPTVLAVTTNPVNGLLDAGQTVTFTVTTSAPVTVVGGTPTLLLSDGGTATFILGSSTPTSLVFSHTVQPGQNTADLSVTSVNLHGAVVADASGNPANLAGAVVNPLGIVAVDTIAPTVTSITTLPGSGTLATGAVVAFTVNMSEAVTVAGGTPTLTLNDGGTATFSAILSTPLALVFTTTVTAGQNSADLAVTAVNLNGAVVSDLAGNAATLAGAVANPAGVLVIDTTAPTVIGVTTNPGTGALDAGATVAITIAMTEPVTVVGGVPTLTLSDGGIATYDRATSTSTNLVFDHIVLAGENTADLTVTGVSLNSAVVTDAAGNTASFAGAVTNPAGVLVIDTMAPTVTGVTTNPSSADLSAGQLVTFTVSLTEPITVVGVPTLQLSDGGTATYDRATSTPTTMVFLHTVLAGQNSADLGVLGIALNGATVADPAGNNANLLGVISNPAGTLMIDTTAPTVTSVITTPNSGVVHAGDTVVFTVATSEPVTVVGGVPTLTLNDGGTATFDYLHSSSTALVFNTVVLSGQNTADLSVIGVNLNGATVADAAGNPSTLSGAVGNPPGILTVVTTGNISPIVLGVVTSPSFGILVSGQSVSFTVSMSTPVTVNGVPTLTLSDGGTATYVSGSSSSSLVFTHLVMSGQNTADLSVMGVNLNGATVVDAAGDTADLSGAVVNPAGVLVVDTTPPTVSGVTTIPGSGTYTTGQSIVFNVTTSEAVTVSGGTPTLTLSDGGFAVYSANTGTNLVFTYTVVSGQSSPDLTVTGINLNGAAVTDIAGNSADFSAVVANPPGVLVIDTAPPSVISLTATPATAALDAGRTVTFTLTMNKAVSVNGVPTLTLSDGGTATYDSNASTPLSLVFTNTVTTGQNSPDLTVTVLTLNGATIRDSAGNNADLTGAVGDPAGTLVIDTTAPTVTGVVTNPAAGALSPGQTVAIDLAMSEATIVTGSSITLTLNDGGIATYDAANSTLTMLAFTHTVLPGQTSADLAITAVNYNSTTVTDAAGNPANLAGAVTNPPGVLMVNAGSTQVTGVTTTPTSGTIAMGGTVLFQLATTTPVTITGGTPTLTLNDGGTAIYDAADSTPGNLVFTYTALTGQNTPDLAITAASLNGATGTGTGGIPFDISGAVTNPAGILLVDAIAPTVSGVTTTPGSGALSMGQTVYINVATSEPVTVVGGPPTLTLNDNGVAFYNSTLSTPTNLVFTQTIVPGQNSPDLTVTGTNLNGAIITDAAGNVANLSGAVGNPAGTLVIDTVAPTVTGVVTSPVTGTLTPGQTVAIDVAMSETTIVTGNTITLALSDGGIATYDAAHTTSTMLAFIHTVLPGQSSADLTITGVNYNGSTATDAAGNAANLTGAVTNPPGTLVINAASTQVTGVTTNPGSGAIAAGGTVLFQLVTTTPVTITGGTPTLTLNDGGTAIYDAVNSTPGNLLFTYTVVTGQNTPDLAITAASLGGATATGTGGIPFDISGAVTNPAGILQIDTTPPAVTNVSTATNNVAAGATVTVTLTMSELVTVVGGTPTLNLNDGGTAVFDPASSAGPTLVFRHTVQQGENTPDLEVTGVNLGGALVTDAAGNVASFAGAISNPTGVLTVDTNPPALTGVTATSTSGSNTVTVGQMLMFGVDVNESVTVTGGIPSLSLSNGGTATYDATKSTPTRLVFGYTPLDGQSTTALTIIGTSLNGATISDPAGNLTDLSALVGNSAGTLTVSAPVAIGVYRFFDTNTGTHFFTADANEKNTLVTPGTSGYRADLVEETNNFGAVDPTVSDPARIQVYRFFDTAHGTHFFTASQTEATGIMTPGSGTYRTDLVYEPSASFYEHATQQAGDVAVYRFFDSTFGTHFYTGDKAEFSAITTPGSASFRTDLVYEGVGFYAPAGTYK